MAVKSSMDKTRQRTRRNDASVGRNSFSSEPPKTKRSLHPMHRPKYQCEWADSIPADNWASYQSAMEALRAAGVPFMLGGGFALATYVGRWRNTKDIDFYIHKQHRQAAIDALAEVGFEDYFSQLPYDRKWIYRSTRSGVIVDIIWAM